MYKIIIFLLFSVSLYAHKNKIVKHEYGNITLISSTGFYTEAINKNLIITQYAEMLSEKLNFKENILVYLSESSYNLGNSISVTYYNNSEKLKENEDYNLNILIHKTEKNIGKCLNIIEFAILNYKTINKFKKVKFNEIYDNDFSTLIKEIIQNKIYRPSVVEELNRGFIYNYFVQNGKFHFFRNNNELKIFDEITDFFVKSNDIVIVFVTPIEIEIIQSRLAYNLEKKDHDLLINYHTIKIDDIDNYYSPYKTNLLGNNIITFESMLGERVLLYSLEKKIFIQDLDEFLSKE